MTPYPLQLAGESLELLPQRALWWAARGTLFVADTHFGKGAAFRAQAIAVPEGSTRTDLARLTELLAAYPARRLVVLGDLLHARAARTPAVLTAVAAWRAQHPALDILLVRGNHDLRAGDPPEAWGIDCVDEPYADGPFVLRHFPEDDPRGYVLAGHVHPGVVLRVPGWPTERLPCFCVGAGHLILPAFGSFTGLAEITPCAGEGVYVVAEDAVVSVPALLPGTLGAALRGLRRRPD